MGCMHHWRLRAIACAASLGLVWACTSNAPAPPPSTSAHSSAPPATSTPASISPSAPSSPVEAAWLTYHHDGARTGVDPSSPAIGSIQRAWASPPRDGDVYAQPLVFGRRILVATENDSIYALAADTGRVLWRTHLGEPVPRSELACGNIDPTGITGTPAIDPDTGVLYAVAFETPARHELVALDTANGGVRFRHPADAPGADPRVHQQRGALLIANGRVYAPFGGLFGDCGEYHGGVVGLALDGSGSLLSYRVPSVRAAGIWAPSGPAVDGAGDLFVATGNSSSFADFDEGNAVIRLSPDLRLLDSFAPANWLALNQGDVDLGSIGPAILDDGLVFQAGKEGVGYLLRAGHLGGIGGQAFSAKVCSGGAFGGTAWMPPFVYVPCTGGLAAVRLESEASFTVAWTGPGFDAGPPIVAGGAVWTVDVNSGDLYAFDARSGRQRFRASLGSVTHFASPSAAGGRLYVAAERQVVAFSGV